MRSSLVIPLALSTILASCFAYGSKNDEKAIRQLYAKLARGMKTMDMALIQQTEGPNFENIAGGHIMSAEIVNEQMRRQFAVTKKVSRFDITLSNISVTGNKAHASTSFTLAATIGPQRKGDHDHKMEVRGQTEENLVKTKHGWLIASTKDLSSNTFVDGKPVHLRKS